MKPSFSRRVLWALLILIALVGVGGCQRQPQPEWKLTDVSGHLPDLDFRLTDDNGKAVTGADFKGKVTLMYFGYTHCPDVCPTTLSDLAGAVRLLGPDAARVQVLFVTVDPARDTPELLAQYVPAFHPGFLGLRGDGNETAKVTKDFKIYAQQRPGSQPGTYTVDHSAQTLVFDTDGRLRLIWPYGIESAKMASDIRILLNSARSPAA
jgi:protein SCO1/2